MANKILFDSANVACLYFISYAALCLGAGTGGETALKVGAVFAIHVACNSGLSLINNKLKGITYPLACW